MSSNRLKGMAAGCLALLALAPGCGGTAPTSVASAEPARAVVRRATAPLKLGPAAVHDDVAKFYRERDFRPLWVKGRSITAEGRSLLRILVEADRDGLDPERYRIDELLAAAEAAESGDLAAVARSDLLLSAAFADYVRDLRAPADDPEMIYVDEELEPSRPTRRAVLDAAAAAPSLGVHLAEMRRMNPVYEGLRAAGAAYLGNPAAAGVIRANLERMRALPADPGKRFVLVDAAGARLWLFEDGRIVDSMRAIVGKNGMETPEMAGLIRFAMLNPYWNLPPDLARDRARRVLREGPGFLKRERLEILSDWSDEARVVGPGSVDWKAVAAGKRTLRMRQLPGGGNAMGAVKFMLPNRLGIYLHDTPNKASFAEADRRISSGCVRVEDAERLSRWLFNGRVVRPASSKPEQRVDLPEPVPVYITYLTALPAKGRIVFQRDVYGRDAKLIARLERKEAKAA